MFTIYGGKTEFNQWDQGQRVLNPKMVVGDRAVFRNASGETHPMYAYEYEGKVVADVPNDLLMMATPILVDLCETTECRTSFRVIAREKPEGYERIDNTPCIPQTPSSGGVSRWNDLPDKPFYEEVGEVCFIDNKTVTSNYDSDFGAFAVSLGTALEQMPLNGNCKVVWDGVSREHAIIETELMGEIYHGFGNLSFFASFGISAPNTGESYAFLVLPSRWVVAFTTDSSATEHTISVSAEALAYHPMEQGYIDIPTLDFVALGLPVLPQNSQGQSIEGDFSAIYETLLKNWIVKVRYAYQSGEVAECIGVAIVNRDFRTFQFRLHVFGVVDFAFDVTRSKITGWQDT